MQNSKLLCWFSKIASNMKERRRVEQIRSHFRYETFQSYISTMLPTEMYSIEICAWNYLQRDSDRKKCVYCQSDEVKNFRFFFLMCQKLFGPATRPSTNQLITFFNVDVTTQIQSKKKLIVTQNKEQKLYTLEWNSSVVCQKTA